MQGRLRNSLLVFIAVTIPTASLGEITISKYRESIKTQGTREMMDIYVAGVGVGLDWANAALTQRGDKPIYCPPSTLSANGAFYTSILLSQIALESTRRTEDELGKIPIELELMAGLENTFPCTRRK